MKMVVNSFNEKNSGNIQLIFEPLSVRVEVPPGTSIYDAINLSGIKVNALCGGKGTCGRCKVRITNQIKGLLSPLTKTERKLLTKEEIENGTRLACRTLVYHSARVYLSDDYLQTKSKILTSGEGEGYDIIIYPKYVKLPRFWKVKLDLNKYRKEIRTHISDFSLIKLALRTELPMLGIYEEENFIETHYACLKKLSDIIRMKRGVVTVTLQTNIDLHHNPIMMLDIEPGDTTKELYGIAVDMGTTTIVGYLIDLITGKTMQVESMLNPQTSIGEDIITRINYAAQSKENLRHAKDLLHDAINEIIDKFVEKINLNKERIVELVVVGNTAIHHLFYELPVSYLGRAPYPPVLQESIRLRNYHLKIKNMPVDSEIFSPPVIAGFVGADTVADIIAVRMDRIERETLLIDIGTNGEIVLGNLKNGLITTSCAAGSAFEGAHIHNGMRGSDGAIEKIRIDPESLQPTIEVIGNTTPMGICGSGIVDIVAEMLKTKILTRSGKFNKKIIENHPSGRFRKGPNGWEYIVHSKEHPAILNYDLKEGAPTVHEDLEIVFTQEDVREVQKAKGAFLAGQLLLMQNKKVSGEEVEQIFIAGAFGTYIHKEQARFIGLIIDRPLERVYQIGNAAGEGAKALLLNTELRSTAESIVKNIGYLELANDPDFHHIYAESMYFPHRNLDLFPSLKEEYKDIPES